MNFKNCLDQFCPVANLSDAEYSALRDSEALMPPKAKAAFTKLLTNATSDAWSRGYDEAASRYE